MDFDYFSKSKPSLVSSSLLINTKKLAKMHPISFVSESSFYENYVKNNIIAIVILLFAAVILLFRYFFSYDQNKNHEHKNNYSD